MLALGTMFSCFDHTPISSTLLDMTGSPEANVTVQRERKKPGRIPTSCAECRRLKLRCDRKIPCGTCIKRGCGSICPSGNERILVSTRADPSTYQGSLTMGKGNRLVLTSTTELHNKIDSMSARIRVLEEALQRSHAQTSNETHPLLSGISPASPNGTEKLSSDSAPLIASPMESDTVIDAFGTLTIGTRGETSFMSSTARTEYLIGRPFEKSQTWATLVQNLRLPQRVIKAAVLEQDIVAGDEELRKIVMDHRPPLPEAIRLCEVYLEWGQTLWYPLTRRELLDEILGSVYSANTYEEISGPHSLALLFSAFALASLYDLSRPANSLEAFEYYVLSRVALEFSPPCTTTTLQALIVVEHNLQWHHLSDLQMDPSRTYVLIGYGVKLAYRMGLHLHSARFQLEKNVVQKRSTLFWRLFLSDTILSFYAGRPPSFSLEWIDTPYPDDEFPVTNNKGETELSWHSWTWRFGRLLHEVLVAAFGAKIPTYSMILELDRRIRDFPIPSRLQLQRDDARLGLQVTLQQLLVLVSKEQVLLNIHRRYFSQALQDSPDDPLKHKYGPSVMATYRSAWRLIEGLSKAVDWIPEIVARMPIFWSLAFSATVVMCMIVTRAPESNLAASSMHEIGVVYEVFKKAASTARNASILLEYVERIWQKSHENAHHPRSECILSRAELDRLGGGSTSVISKSMDGTSHSGCPLSKSSPDPSASYSNSSNINVHSSSRDSSSIHPRIMQDMQSFDGFRASSTAAKGIEYATPEQFSQSMIDTQLSHFCLEAEKAMAQAGALNAFHPSQPPPFNPGGARPLEGITLDPAWQSFMEQLGF